MDGRKIAGREAESLLPICTEVVLTEQMLKRLRHEGIKMSFRSPAFWVILSLFLGFVVFFFAVGEVTFGVEFLAAVVMWLGLVASRIFSRTKRVVHAISIGTVMRLEFRSSDFTYWTLRGTTNELLGQTFLTPRSTIVRDYLEIKNVAVKDDVVGVTFSSRPDERQIFPREVFPDEALALLSHYTKIG